MPCAMVTWLGSCHPDPQDLKASREVGVLPASLVSLASQPQRPTTASCPNSRGALATARVRCTFALRGEPMSPAASWRRRWRLELAKEAQTGKLWPAEQAASCHRCKLHCTAGLNRRSATTHRTFGAYRAGPQPLFSVFCPSDANRVAT